jgi:hypothetical protein
MAARVCKYATVATMDVLCRDRHRVGAMDDGVGPKLPVFNQEAHTAGSVHAGQNYLPLTF